MKTKLHMWGNSLALRIPKPFATEAGLENQSPIELLLEEGKLIISKSTESPLSLEDLLQGVTAENIHREVETGSPVGNEVW